MSEVQKLEELAKLVRYFILKMTSRAQSGHPTSSMSATDLMVALYFNKLRFDLKDTQNLANDRVIFSKGHASPLFYSLYRVAGVLSDKDLEGYRKVGSKLEGHPRPNFPYAEAATGSLGQGLSIGLGMAMAAKMDEISNTTYVLMGDSEMAEGSVWEALEIASYYQVDNLVAIVDINRLGQRGETMLGWQIEKYRERAETFGWEVHEVDGHDFEAICETFEKLPLKSGRPQMILAKTIKGKGVSFLEDKDNWHGKALGDDELKEALFALGDVNTKLVGKIEKPTLKIDKKITESDSEITVDYKIGEEIATRKAFGETLSKLGIANSKIVSLDAEVKNSTFSEIFEKEHAGRFFEMFIAEQNMVGVAIGMAKMGKIPFVSTFSAFLTRSFDQIRMGAYSDANVKFVGSHSGVSIGEDGPSQMGLEEISMFRSILDSRIFVPSDAVSCAKILEIAAKEKGIFYISTLRPATPVIYNQDEKFEIGGSKVLLKSDNDKVLLITCGITVHEALRAAEELGKEGIAVRVMDAYSVKPIDNKSITEEANKIGGRVIVIEDHYFDGGLGDEVLNVFALSKSTEVYKMAVSKMPISANGEEQLKYQGIDSASIVKKVKEVLG